MDDPETLHRRARLRELIERCFNERIVDLLNHIENRTGTRPNQGEMSAIRRDNSGKSFGDKKAKTLVNQIGLNRRWFDMPIGVNVHPDEWRNGYEGIPSEATPTEIAEAFENGSEEKREALVLLARLPDTEANLILPLLRSILSKYE